MYYSYRTKFLRIGAGVIKGNEPLKTLRTYRMYNGTNKILQASLNGIFGLCYAVAEEGS